MKLLLDGYDLAVQNGVVQIKPGTTFTFEDPEGVSSMDSPQARRWAEQDFEAAFDKVAAAVLNIDGLCGDLSVCLRGLEMEEDHFRSAFTRALKLRGESARMVNFVPCS